MEALPKIEPCPLEELNQVMNFSISFGMLAEGGASKKTVADP